MFGIGLTELILIAIIALLFLGPDKLPDALVQLAKFIRSTKKMITDAKGALEEEVRINELKEEALSYKAELDKATKELQNFKNIDFDDLVDDITYEEDASHSAFSKAHDDKEVEKPMQSVTLKRKKSATTEDSAQKSLNTNKSANTLADEKESKSDV